MANRYVCAQRPQTIKAQWALCLPLCFIIIYLIPSTAVTGQVEKIGSLIELCGLNLRQRRFL